MYAVAHNIKEHKSTNRTDMMEREEHYFIMQITNILRDLKEDSKMDRIYIPLDEIKQFNYSEFELKKFLKNKNFNLLMKFQADRAQKYYPKSKNLFHLIIQISNFRHYR